MEVKYNAVLSYKCGIYVASPTCRLSDHLGRREKTILRGKSWSALKQNCIFWTQRVIVLMNSQQSCLSTQYQASQCSRIKDQEFSILNIEWRITNFWWHLGKKEWVFFEIMAPFQLTVLQWISPKPINILPVLIGLDRLLLNKEARKCHMSMVVGRWNGSQRI